MLLVHHQRFVEETLIAKSAPKINKFKNLLDRDPKLLVNKFDCDSYFLKENCSILMQA